MTVRKTPGDIDLNDLKYLNRRLGGGAAWHSEVVDFKLLNETEETAQLLVLKKVVEAYTEGGDEVQDEEDLEKYEVSEDELTYEPSYRVYTVSLKRKETWTIGHYYWEVDPVTLPKVSPVFYDESTAHNWMVHEYVEKKKFKFEAKLMKAKAKIYNVKPTSSYSLE